MRPVTMRVWAGMLWWGVLSAAAGAAEVDVKVTANTSRLMPYQVFELTFQHSGKYHHPTWDVTIDVTFGSPGGGKKKVGGDAAVWDAFPRDRKEWRDTDGDGVGDNADTDDDGDGWTDAEEAKAGTDPLSAVSFPG